MSKVIQIRHGVAVELSNRIQLPVIPNRSNCRVRFGHNMKRRTPGTFGRSNNALSKKKFKFYLHCIIQFRCSLLGLAVTGGPVVIIWWTVPCDADLEIKEGLLRSDIPIRCF
ncbi:hypothetical protein TNCV_1154211 [Trichonephila clavipes]|nr:hypothetical protein TNCV_1154211 [Trichonephila clavipes]